MLTAPSKMPCAGCGKDIKEGQKISVTGLCYDCYRKTVRNQKESVGGVLRKLRQAGR